MKRAVLISTILCLANNATGETLGNDNTIVALEAEGLWRVVGCEPVYDLTTVGEPIVAWHPRIKRIEDEEIHSFPPYVDEADGNEKVLLSGTWIRLDATQVWEEWFDPAGSRPAHALR